MEEKRPNTPRNSTVAVSPEIGKKLERFVIHVVSRRKILFPFR